MGKEIERKFLVVQSNWQQVQKPVGHLYKQGYILNNPEKTIRVRLVGKKGFLTIKGKSIGAVRDEYEYEIPETDARELLEKFSVGEVSKIRYKILYENKIWEVDEYLGNNEGLIIAEIELVNELENFSFPTWVGKEVTWQQKFYNSNLAIDPFCNWK